MRSLRSLRFSRRTDIPPQNEEVVLGSEVGEPHQTGIAKLAEMIDNRYVLSDCRIALAPIGSIRATRFEVFWLLGEGVKRRCLQAGTRKEYSPVVNRDSCMASKTPRCESEVPITHMSAWYTSTMEVRALGATGIQAPIVGIGCWAIGGPAFNLDQPMGWSTANDDESRAGLAYAYENGVRLFDTADVYGLGKSERLLGELVDSVDRESLVLVSKTGYFAGTSRHAYERLHMRHQLEQTLENLRTDYIDIYFFHHNNFGVGGEYLQGALDFMENAQAQGLVRNFGMRGPHRYALERGKPYAAQNKTALFSHIAEQIRPKVITLRDNLLTPREKTEGLYTWAKDHDCGVIVNKPLGQGLLTGKYVDPIQFAPGDHRSRKTWFQEPQLGVVRAAIDEIRQLANLNQEQLVGLAFWHCLSSYNNAVVLTGFTKVEQLQVNLSDTALSAPDSSVLELARRVLGEAQETLDRLGDMHVNKEHKS